MGNCASEPKTKGDDAAALAPEPRMESVQATDDKLMKAEPLLLQEEEGKAADHGADAHKTNNGPHTKQPSLGALLKEEEEKTAELEEKTKLEEAEEKANSEAEAEEKSKLEEKAKATEERVEIVAVELEKALSEAAPPATPQSHQDNKSDTIIDEEIKKPEAVIFKETKPEEINVAKPEVTIMEEAKPEVVIMEEAKPKVVIMKEAKPKVVIMEEAKPEVKEAKPEEKEAKVVQVKEGIKDAEEINNKEQI